MVVNRIFAVLTALAVILVFGFFPGCKGAPPRRPEAVPAPPPPPVPPKPKLARPRVPEPPPLTLDLDPRLSRIDAVARKAIATGGFPGAVILVGHQGKIVYYKAFGYQSVLPQRQPMTKDTIFDLASLTKVVATTTAIMQLVDEGKVHLNDPVGKYWPAFNRNGKKHITIKHLLTHCSGLRPEVNSRVRWHGYEGAIFAISEDHPVKTPGTCFKYSDANFIALGEIVHRVSGLPLDVYCKKKVFQPLGLRHTRFLPPASWQSHIAPADIWGDRLRWGEVHDPTANRMGGVAGNAGVFSTAEDLAVFVEMLLDGGVSRGKRILSAKAVAAMTRPYHIPGSSIQRGLGWDIESPFSKEHNAAFPRGSFGHTGYTGTSIWADPHSKTFLIILTNRLHPDGRGRVKPLRAGVASSVAAALHMGPPARVAAWDPGEVVLAGHGQSDSLEHVQPGIEVLAASGFALLKGKRVGLITNHSGIDGARRSTIELLQQAPGVKLRAIFSPEHGLEGILDCKISSGCNDLTGLPVYSLYGKVKKPTPRMLQGLDALVYDIQDVGARYYTYITTMAYAMEAAADAGLEFYVLDRPNPINAAAVQGPVMDSDMKSFIGYYPMPVRYGMTPGEVARLYNREAHIGARLQVVPMKGYRRQAWFDETGLPWVNPSPNLRSLRQSILYCGVGIVESANVSVGRGTATPFEVMGAPWINRHRLARYLEKRQIPGVEFEPVTFVPKSSRYHGRKCEGVRFLLVDRDKFDGPVLGIELAAALHRLYPGKFDLGNTLGMIGSRDVVRAIQRGADPREICRGWQPQLSAFLQKRQKYLLY
jgi:uncharacterized protein YbbC (DUF1343 family)/CubicO group peptidase (beta-lactamase class C family)